jgi:hypothetical protein
MEVKCDGEANKKYGLYSWSVEKEMDEIEISSHINTSNPKYERLWCALPKR